MLCQSFLGPAFRAGSPYFHVCFCIYFLFRRFFFFSHKYSTSYLFLFFLLCRLASYSFFASLGFLSFFSSAFFAYSFFASAGLPSAFFIYSFFASLGFSSFFASSFLCSFGFSSAAFGASPFFSSFTPLFNKYPGSISAILSFFW